MKKIAMLFTAGLFLAALSSMALGADPYDRYERGRVDSPPPRLTGEPPPQHAVYGQPYYFGHIGFFEPNDDAPTPTGGGLGGYSSGGSFDFGIGSRISPVLAIEGALAGFSAGRGRDDVSVIPLTFGVRLIVPNPVVEPYFGAGLGMYFADLQEPGINDSDATIGGYAAVGIDAWLNPRIALNFEGKYHFAKPTFNGIEVDVSGWTLGMGIRLSF
jgi:hypothetical protein